MMQTAKKSKTQPANNSNIKWQNVRLSQQQIKKIKGGDDDLVTTSAEFIGSEDIIIS